jgi:glycosyltransferase involved in cell wall biosynthesis
MNVIQSSAWFLPQHTGGTEVYVAGLASHLKALGISSTVAVPVDSAGEAHELWEGIPVYRYPAPAQTTYQQQIGVEPHGEFDRFERWLGRQPAAIYHQHSWTYGCGLHHLRAARRRGLRTVLTVHVPGPVCLRGTMLREGKEQCDGVIRERTCAACWLGSRGMPGVSADVLSRIPVRAARWLRPLGRVGTALSATSLAQDHRDHLLSAANNADHVVAVCEWLHEALLRNGVPREKLSLNRQGTAEAGAIAANRAPFRNDRPLSVAFVGRWDPVKGVDVLVEAMLLLPPGCPVQLQIVAIQPTDPVMTAYMDRVRARAAAHPGIRIQPPLAPGQMAQFLASVDVLAVPSQWLETGPLVVLEAFAAGTPVLGSSLGGIRELVKDGRNGRLLRHDKPRDWADALLELAAAPHALEAWRSGIGPVRSMRDVAMESRDLYASLLKQPAGG